MCKEITEVLIGGTTRNSEYEPTNDVFGFMKQYFSRIITTYIVVIL